MPITAPKEKLIPLAIRLPEDWHAMIKEQARHERRSLNAQLLLVIGLGLEALARRTTTRAHES